MHNIKNWEMGHFTKGQSGQIEKTKEQIMYVAKKKAQGETPTS